MTVLGWPMKRWYADVHYRIYNWVCDGHFQFEGTHSRTAYGDLDRFILNLFGYGPQLQLQETLIEAARLFNADVSTGGLDIDWLFTEHGLTLFKAKIAKGA